MYFTNKGRVYTTKGYQIPEGNRTSKGIPLVNILNLQLLQLNEKIITLMRKGTNSQEEKHKWKYTHAKTHTSVKKKLRKSQECLFKQV